MCGTFNWCAFCYSGLARRCPAASGSQVLWRRRDVAGSARWDGGHVSAFPSECPGSLGEVILYQSLLLHCIHVLRLGDIFYAKMGRLKTDWGSSCSRIGLFFSFLTVCRIVWACIPEMYRWRLLSCYLVLLVFVTLTFSESCVEDASSVLDLW